MTPFVRINSVAAPMPEADIDTDIVFPARFLLLTDKCGLGRHAFHDKRFAADGSRRDGFVLDQPAWAGAAILVAGPNFGCGSSREQAPWALAELGIRCIVAPGFGEIFRANCFANGLLPIVLDKVDHARVMQEALAARPMTIDLSSCRIELADGASVEVIRFEVPKRQRDALLAGLDEIDSIQRHEAQRIAGFECRQRERMPWLYPASAALPGPTLESTDAV